MGIANGNRLLRSCAILNLILPLWWKEMKENLSILYGHNWWRTLYELVFEYDWKGTTEAFVEDGKSIYKTYLASDILEIYTFFWQVHERYISSTAAFQTLVDFIRETKARIFESAICVESTQTLEKTILPQLSSYLADGLIFVEPHIAKVKHVCNEIWERSEEYIKNKMKAKDNASTPRKSESDSDEEIVENVASTDSSSER